MMRNILLFLITIGFFNNAINAQIQDKVDFLKGNISIEILPKEKQIIGTVAYKFDVLSAVDSIFLDAKNINFTAVLLNRKKVKYVNDSSHIIIKKKFKKGETYTLFLSYTAQPKQTVYFIGYNDTIPNNEQVWTQGQGKYTSHWLPCFDDMNEKVEFDMNITFDEKYQVVANGTLVKKEPQKSKSILWHFDMEKPMSSYLLAFVIGKYSMETITSTSGIPIALYYYPTDSLNLEPTYRYSRQIFDFLETEIGIAYPWNIYKQIPVKDFLYAGMENTSATIFSDAYSIDSTAFVDKNYVNVNAHELAHQWFGDLITEVDGNSHWLHEGFATYYALLAEKEIFGADYFYWKLFDSAEILKSVSADGRGEALANDKASSITYYQKGAWALVMLRNEIGNDAFSTGIKTYLEKYKYKNATIQNFLDEMEKSSGKSLVNFESEWLLAKEFPHTKTEQFLKNNNLSLAAYFELQNNLNDNLDAILKKEIINTAFSKTSSIHLKRNILLNTPQELISDSVFKQAFSSADLLTRQAIAITTTTISENLKPEFESLLNDKSYVTIENALLKLWYNFPLERKKYLAQTKAIIGLPEKNVRLLWLTLALATENYNSLKTKDYFDELGSYTNPEYSTETRQKAFLYLYQTLGLTDQHLLNLTDAATHHSWQFKKFARTLIDELVKDDDYKNRFIALIPMLNTEEKRYINSKVGLE